MPRSRRPPSESDYSEEEELDFSQSQAPRRGKPSTSQAVRQDDEPENMANLVTETVKLILCFSNTRTPFKRIELVKIAMNNLTSPKHIAKVLQQAKETLESVYNMELHDVKSIKASKELICIAKHSFKCMEELSEEDVAEMTLLHLILEYIFMKGGEVSDVTLWEYLGKLEIHRNEEHEFFGDVTDLIENVFQKQLYLHSEKVTSEGSTADRTILKWGERADLEYDKREILEMASARMDLKSIQFLSQYQEAFGEIDDDNVDNELSEMTQDGLGLASQPKTQQPKARTSKRDQVMEIDDDDSDD